MEHSWILNVIFYQTGHIVIGDRWSALAKTIGTTDMTSAHVFSYFQIWTLAHGYAARGAAALLSESMNS